MAKAYTVANPPGPVKKARLPSALLDCSFYTEKSEPRPCHLNVTEGPQYALPKSFSPCARTGGFGQGSTCSQGVGLGLGLGLREKQSGNLSRVVILKSC